MHHICQYYTSPLCAQLFITFFLYRAVTRLLYACSPARERALHIAYSVHAGCACFTMHHRPRLRIAQQARAIGHSCKKSGEFCMFGDDKNPAGTTQIGCCTVYTHCLYVIQNVIQAVCTEIGFTSFLLIRDDY